jgi:hypothetical protein
MSQEARWHIQATIVNIAFWSGLITAASALFWMALSQFANGDEAASKPARPRPHFVHRVRGTDVDLSEIIAVRWPGSAGYIDSRGMIHQGVYNYDTHIHFRGGTKLSMTISSDEAQTLYDRWIQYKRYVEDVPPECIVCNHQLSRLWHRWRHCKNRKCPLYDRLTTPEGKLTRDKDGEFMLRALYDKDQQQQAEKEPEDADQD